jgi:hypothetical protein
MLPFQAPPQVPTPHAREGAAVRRDSAAYQALT